MPDLTVTIDRSLCIGAASCAGTAPQFFRLDEDNVAELITSNPVPADEATRKLILEAAESCPTGAIKVG